MAAKVTEIYQNSYGFKITLTVGPGKLDTTSAMALRIKRPDATVVSRSLAAETITSVTDGTVVYTVVDGDFPLVGVYNLQLIDVTPGRFLPSNIIILKATTTLGVS